MHVTNINNVEASLNLHFVDRLSAISLPAWFALYNIAYNWPEEELNTPCFSFTHLPVSTEMPFQGNVESDTLSVSVGSAILEINCWVSRDDVYNGQQVWVARLQYMHSMVQQVMTREPIVVIQDVVTDPNFPTPAGYKIDLMRLTNPATLPDDENPSIRRRRLLINYMWRVRAVI